MSMPQYTPLPPKDSSPIGCFCLIPDKMSPEIRAKLSSRRRQVSDAIPGSEVEIDPENQNAPLILLLGPPGAGKTTLGLLLAARYGNTLVSVEAEAKAAAEAGSEQGSISVLVLAHSSMWQRGTSARRDSTRTEDSFAE